MTPRLPRGPLRRYEACGLLLGAGLAPAEQLGEQLSRLLEPPISQLRLLSSQVTSGSPPGLSTSLDATALRQLSTARAAEAAFYISAIAVVSKGLPSSGEDEASRVLREGFTAATRVALASVGSFADSTEVRGKCLMLLHRMVETIGEELLGFLTTALPQLLSSAGAPRPCSPRAPVGRVTGRAAASRAAVPAPAPVPGRRR